MKIIAIANQKGGVGKTTTAINVSAGLAAQGFKTLLIDLDPQGNTTKTFFPLPEHITQSLTDVLVGGDKRLSLAEALYNTHIPNLQLAPATISLARLDQHLQIPDQFRLKEALDTIPNVFDFIIIDCPPALGTMLNQAVNASQYILVPVGAEFFPLQGVVDLIDTITLTKKYTNPSLLILGFVVTQFDTRNAISGQAHAKLQEMFGEKVFDTVIRRNVKLIYAPAHVQTIYEFAPKSSGSEDYSDLTAELLEKLQIKSNLHIVKNKAVNE